MPVFKAQDIARWCEGAWKGPEPANIQGVSIDTRTLQPGNLYIAIRGENHDGHAFVTEAVRRGAAAVLVSAPVEAGRPALRVADTRKALIDLAKGYRSAMKTRIVSVTGSVGKTTVKEMTADILGTTRRTYRSRGNWNNDVGLPLSMLAMEPDQEAGVFEVGMNHPGELQPLCELLRPEIGIMTAIGPVHLEFFESVEAIAQEKATLFRVLPAEGLAILSSEEPWFDLLRRAAPCRVVTTSLNGRDADYLGDLDTVREGVFSVQEKATGETMEFESPLPGEHVIRNALLAIAAGRQAGVDWNRIRQALMAYEPAPMRWAEVRQDGVLFINDAYNANPVSMRAALAAFSRVHVKGMRWLALGGMRELGKTEREEHLRLGREIACGGWAGLVTVGELGATIAEGARIAGWPEEKTVSCRNHAEAAKALRKRVQVEDGVLLKASRGEHMEDVLRYWKEEANHEVKDDCCAML